jgi:sporulation integral membrane protein YlbJ
MENKKITAYKKGSKNKNEAIRPTGVSTFISLGAVLTVFLLSLLVPDRIAHSVKSGLDLCYRVIIPSIFPFLILSDLLYRICDFSGIKYIGEIFERFFKVNRSGILAFALGACCGFPLGVKCCVEGYESGELSRSEAQRLIGFCNNTGPAFIISGIGLGLRGSLSDGVILYLSMILSAIAVGVIFSLGESASHPICSLARTKDFSITESIKNAGMGTVNICSFITFFACVVGLLRAILGESLPYLIIIGFIEVGSATSVLSKTAVLNNTLSLACTGFAIGFSGLSVHLQALSYISKTDIPIKKYFLMKFIQGILSSVAVILLNAIIS